MSPLSSLENPLGGIAAALGSAASEGALESIGKLVVARLHDILSTPGPEPSAPGEYPHMQTGDLRGSYRYDLGHDGLGSYVDIGTDIEYAPLLEYGTSIMAARPHFRPAIEFALGSSHGTAAFAGMIVTIERAVIARYPRTIIHEAGAAA
jgi:hypothetical protein